MHRTLEVPPLVDPGSDQGQLAPEQAKEADRPRLRVDGDHDQPPANGQLVDGRVETSL